MWTRTAWGSASRSAWATCWKARSAYEFAVANILADVIIMLSDPLRQALKAGGIFVCSGIIRDREEDVRRALLQNNYEIIDTRHRGEWVAFAARR